jgi:two-component system response regulator PilR (NtrC family)
VIRVELPPLSERREDIGVLADGFVRRFAAEMGKDVVGFTGDALRALERYAYPGNVRELENIVERGVALAGARAIGLGDLPEEVSGMAGAPAPALISLPQSGIELDEVLAEAERRLLLEALERAGGVRKAAARLLGVTFRSLRYRLAKHGLASDDEAESSDEPEAGSEA